MKGAEHRTKRKSKTIVVAGGKGGVGKSNVSVNLAIIFKDLGYFPIIFDGDTNLANVSQIIGAPEPRYDFTDVLRGKRTIKEITYQRYGVDFIPGASDMEELQRMSYAERQNRIIGQMNNLDRSYDLFILDAPAGLNDYVLSMAGMADEVIIVTCPEPPSRSDSFKLINAITTKNTEKALKEILQKHSIEDTVLAYLQLKRPLSEVITRKYGEDFEKGGKDYALAQLAKPLEELTDTEEGISSYYHRFILKAVAKAGLENGESINRSLTAFWSMSYSLPFIASIANEACKFQSLEITQLNLEVFGKVSEIGRAHGFDAENLTAYCIDRLGISPRDAMSFFKVGLTQSGLSKITPFLMMKKFSAETLEDMNGALFGLHARLIPTAEEITDCLAKITSTENWLMDQQQAEKYDLEGTIAFYARKPDYNRTIRGQNPFFDSFVTMFQNLESIDATMKAAKTPDIARLIELSRANTSAFSEISAVKARNDGPLRLLVNMADTLTEGKDQYFLMKGMVEETSPQRLESSGTVCRDPELIKAIKVGTPIVRYNDQCESSINLRTIALQTANRLFEANISTDVLEHEGFGTRWLKRLGL